MNTIKNIFLFTLLATSLVVNSQVLDDSTHLEFGSFSTKYYTDQYFFEDSIILNPIDSSFFNQHEYDKYYQDGQFYQNLGNTVTPSLSLLFEPTNNVTQSLAADRFSVFRFNKKRYFNTESPYTFLKYMQGSRNDQILEGMYTQNISKNWNVGSEFYRGVSRKQYSPDGSKDNLGTVWVVRGFTSYLSDNKRYHLLGDVETQNSKSFEQWGIYFLNDSAHIVDAVIDAGEYATDNWNTGSNEQVYRNFSVKQRYDLVKGYSGVYFNSSYKRDKRIYRDDKLKSSYSTRKDTSIIGLDTIYSTDTLSQDPVFYRAMRFRFDTTYDVKLFDSFENEVGIYVKSDLWHFKIGYLQQNYGYENSHQSSKVYGIDNVIKAKFNYNFIDKFNVKIATNNNLSGAFNTMAEIKSKYASLSYNKVLSNPFLQDNYLNSNHAYWNNDFKKINSDEYKFKLGYTYKSITVETENRYLNINNQVFYDTTFTPLQDESTINIFQSNNKILLNMKKWNFEQRVLYTSKNNDYIQLPELVSHTRIYWVGKLSKGVINAQIGADLQWRSSYYANGYLPITQNFYAQQNIRTFGYPLVDFFANMNIKTADFFFKLGHINQGLGRPGYLTSAYSPAKRFNFTLGIKWRFFD